MKYPAYAIFLKSWWLIHSKYDDRYLNLVILFTPVTLVTLFQSYNLQGRVYHCFGIFWLHWYFSSQGGIVSWYFTIFIECLRWITIKQESVTKVLANIWLLATPCCIIWSDPFYLHSRPRRLFTILMLIFNSKKLPVPHLVLNKHYLITCFPFLHTFNS